LCKVFVAGLRKNNNWRFVGVINAGDYSSRAVLLKKDDEMADVHTFLFDNTADKSFLTNVTKWEMDGYELPRGGGIVFEITVPPYDRRNWSEWAESVFLAARRIYMTG